jgi:hypothetical protein
MLLLCKNGYPNLYDLDRTKVYLQAGHLRSTPSPHQQITKRPQSVGHWISWQLKSLEKFQSGDVKPAKPEGTHVSVNQARAIQDSINSLWHRVLERASNSLGFMKRDQARSIDSSH